MTVKVQHTVQGKADNPRELNKMAIGRVVNNNDPQQMGRVQAICEAFGDDDNFTQKTLPWCISVSPLAGTVQTGTRGPDESSVDGPVAYGMWNVPKVGSYILVGKLEGDSGQRVYFGCVNKQSFTHTMPHGRFLWNDDVDDKRPDGPLDTFERPIQPTYENLSTHFSYSGQYHADETQDKTSAQNSFERTSRAADRQVSAYTELQVSLNDEGNSSDPDHQYGLYNTITEPNGKEYTVKGAGYGIDQQNPNKYFNTTTFNYDSMVYSWTTPGFHSISMDDRHENNRIRIRTTAGHQILMDDTNERMYINTAKGNTWIEIDQVGNIDIFAAKDISTHAEGDINFTAGKTFRVQAKEGIHMVSDEDIRMHSKAKNAATQVQDNGNETSYNGIHMKSDKKIHMESADDTHINIGKTLYLSTDQDTNINTGNKGLWSTVDEMHHLSGKNQYYTSNGGYHIHLNGPPADGAESAEESYESFIASRIPEHEPWARIYSKPFSADGPFANSFSPYPEKYTDDNIGKIDRDGNVIERSKYWHR